MQYVKGKKLFNITTEKGIKYFIQANDIRDSLHILAIMQGRNKQEADEPVLIEYIPCEQMN